MQVPPTARVGTPFTVTVTSFGGGCITPAGTLSGVKGLAAEVRPLREEVVGGVCPAVLSRERHAATVEFGRTGEARVRILGLARPSEEPYVVERRVTVFP